MSTANKLTYLNATKTKLKNVINYSGANITNDTFRSYPEKLYNEFVDFVTNGTDSLYSSLPKVTGEDTELTLNNTANGVLKLDFKGNTSQDGEPTPENPQQIHVVTGDNDVKIENKNWFDKNNVDWYRNNDAQYNQTLNSSTTRIRTTGFSIKGGKTYTVSGYPNIVSLLAVRGYDSKYNHLASGVTRKGDVFTLTSDVAYIHLLFAGENFTNETNILMKNANIQIEESTEPTSYIPHQEQTYRVDFGGKNKFDKDTTNVLNAYFDNVATTITANNSNRTIYLPCKPNTTYSITQGSSSLSNHLLQIANTDEEPQIGTQTYNFQNHANDLTFTYTTNSTARYIVIRLRVGDYVDSFLSTIQIEEDTEATRYSRYVENPIEMCEIGGYEDKLFKNTTDNPLYNADLELNKWYKYGVVGKVVLDGSETWETQYTGDRHGWRTEIDNIQQTASTSDMVNLLSNYYKNGTQNEIYNATYGIGQRANQNQIIIKNDNITDTNNFKTWLSTHNTEVYYVLTTPTYTLLDDTLQEQLDEIYYNAVSYEDETNISQTNADLPFVIGASAIKKYSE